ncbi:hypothetical protein COO60DRAFT_1625748 [Scenedesmus sp. NREL 46B-D3]|nr:hypothetical protein COO60DRAFT_1625748 [Scenedesmus sp. NREL 46B-D3]
MRPTSYPLRNSNSLKLPAVLKHQDQNQDQDTTMKIKHWLEHADARFLHQTGRQPLVHTDADSAHREWAVEYAALGTPAAVAAAETDAKAYYAANFDPKAPKARLLRSDTSSILTAVTAPGRHQLSNSNMGGARHLLAERVDRQDRNTMAIQATANEIQAALTSASAQPASKAGLHFSRLATSNSVSASEFTGARHLLAERVDRQDRNTMAIQATANEIQAALTSASAQPASKAGLHFSKLATSNSVSASDFTGARHLLAERTDR